MRNHKKALSKIPLTIIESQALQKIKSIVTTRFPVERMALFGSVVRGEADEESDIDLLVVTKRPLDRQERHQITDIVCEVNLDYGTNFSTLVVDSQAWDHGPISLLSIHEEIQREGVLV
jgi:predicted nucleotidyltransferase